MSTTLSSSINMLNSDVLLDIFTLNANMFMDRGAPKTTRITAQVCRCWRDLMLDTPSLWAKLIDIEGFSENRGKNWRDKVLRRSGTSLLWIRIANVGYTETLESLVINLIRKNSDLIQKLVVFDPCLTVTRSMFHFPVPQLDHFEASIQCRAEELETRATISLLFADCAPRLRILKLVGHAVDQWSSWMRHLHSIVIDYSYSLPHALAILSATPNLQELKIGRIITGDITTPLPIVKLSKMKYIEYIGLSNETATLLAHIEIPAGCSLKIQLNKFTDRSMITQNKPIIVSFINTFIRHAERSSHSLTFTDIELDYKHDSHVSFICRSTLRVECLLSISIPLCGDVHPTLLEFISRRLLLSDLKGTIKLRFHSSGRLSAYFRTIFNCFPSVEVLSVDPNSLVFLVRLQNRYTDKATKKPRILFPVLRIIHHPIHEIYSQCDIKYGVHEHTAGFLLSRMQAGHAIITLDMTHCSPLKSRPNLDKLAELKGLKVLYKLSSDDETIVHICGDNAPGKVAEAI